MTDPQLPWDLTDQIRTWAANGWTTDEMAAEAGLPPQRVKRIARRARVQLNPRGAGRRLGPVLAKPRYDPLKALAEAARVSPAVMAGRLLAIALDEGFAPAARRLGKLAKPK